ncbi:MAG: hypothetical protein GXP31_14565 [Kiritimatiellaeota bacterium]|nr:hypothetical protein [Kiritimatiellota bacterium]
MKQVGAPYSRLRQPWNGDEFMPEAVCVPNLWGDVAGWQIDGPTDPKTTGERQFNNRWGRFSCDEVAVFYRRTLPDEIRPELDLLTGRARRGVAFGVRRPPYRLLTHAAHIAPSIIRLRALLLEGPPEELAALAPPDKWKGRGADVAATCVPFLRNSRPPRRVELIPPAKADSALGLERLRTAAESPCVTLAIEAPKGQ